MTGLGMITPSNSGSKQRGHPLRYLAAARMAITYKQRFVYDPEYVSGALMEWAETKAPQPGKPWENGYCESYNGRMPDELLDLYIFESTGEVQQIATEWLWSYKMNARIWATLGYLPPRN